MSQERLKALLLNDAIEQAVVALRKAMQGNLDFDEAAKACVDLQTAQPEQPADTRVHLAGPNTPVYYVLHADGTYSAANPQPAQPEPVELTDEQDRALCEAYCNTHSDEYFKARPQLDSDVNRRIFYAGHRKAWITVAAAKGGHKC